MPGMTVYEIAPKLHQIGRPLYKRAAEGCPFIQGMRKEILLWLLVVVVVIGSYKERGR